MQIEGKKFMQQFKIYILSALFILGLLTSPTISFEDRVDVALKFESGLSVKSDIAKGIFNHVINTDKTNSATNLDFILSEHKFGLSKIDDDHSSQSGVLYANNNISTKHIYYLNNVHRHCSLSKNIYQLKSLRI